MGVFNRLLINEQLNLQSSTEKVFKTIDENPSSGFYVETTDKGYRFLATYSIGTLITRGGTGPAPGISIIGTFYADGASSSHVILSSQIRIELFFILGIWLIMIGVAIVNGTSTVPVNLLYWMPLYIIGMWLAYRVQEYLLLKKVEKFLSGI